MSQSQRRSWGADFAMGCSLQRAGRKRGDYLTQVVENYTPAKYGIQAKSACACGKCPNDTLNSWALNAWEQLTLAAVCDSFLHTCAQTRFGGVDVSKSGPHCPFGSNLRLHRVWSGEFHRHSVGN